MKRLSTFLILALLAAMPLFSQDAPASSEARVGPRDVVEIKVFQDPSLNTRTQITEDGRINMPLLGKVEVAGQTTSQVEAHIKALLEAKYITKADVSVQVVEYGNKPISVVGAVTRPGSIGATANITLIQAITQAGGLAPGYGKTLYVLRTGQNGLTEQISIDIEDLLVNGNPDLNVPLAPNDVINVPVDTPIMVYVLGEVMHPGVVQFRRSQTPTLLQALAGAGGPTDRASKTVRIKRTANGQPQTITVDFKKISRGNKADEPLFDNDTIYVNESFF
ncbi:MAG: sugar transporter [Acidobacteria bacterium]|nr:sugar transporter [Acidobacteriota bacterium]